MATLPCWRRIPSSSDGETDSTSDDDDEGDTVLIDSESEARSRPLDPEADPERVSASRGRRVTFASWTSSASPSEPGRPRRTRAMSAMEEGVAERIGHAAASPSPEGSPDASPAASAASHASGGGGLSIARRRRAGSVGNGLSNGQTPRRRSQSNASNSSATGIEDLPDLTHRIQKLGMLQEYAAYRQGYLRWRQGDHKGAKGSIFIDKTFTEEDDLPWYAKGAAWSFNNTLSYWIAVLFLRGAIIFTLSCSLALFPEEIFAVNRSAVVHWTLFVGGMDFTVATYLMCVETSELMEETKTIFSLRFFNAVGVLSMLDEAGIGPEPYIASMTYFLGAVTYTIPVIVECAEIELEHNSLMYWILLTIPYIIAGFLFLAGAFTECLQHELFTRGFHNHGAWGAGINVIGGLCFFLAGVVYIWSVWWCYFLFAIGSFCYVVGSLIMVIMWKDEQFGLLFLVAINDIRRPPTASPHFSLRGLAFLILSLFISVMVAYNFTLALRAFLNQKSWLLLGAAFNEGAPFVALHMFLAVLSANYRTPKEQPYHTLMIMSRWALLFLFLKAAMTFYFSLIDDHFFPETGQDKNSGKGGFYDCASDSVIPGFSDNETNSSLSGNISII